MTAVWCAHPRLFPERGGQYSAHFYEQLKGDCPGCPWWREVRLLYLHAHNK